MSAARMDAGTWDRPRPGEEALDQPGPYRSAVGRRCLNNCDQLVAATGGSTEHWADRYCSAGCWRAANGLAPSRRGGPLRILPLAAADDAHYRAQLARARDGMAVLTADLDGDGDGGRVARTLARRAVAAAEIPAEPEPPAEPPDDEDLADEDEPVGDQADPQPAEEPAAAGTDRCPACGTDHVVYLLRREVAR